MLRNIHAMFQLPRVSQLYKGLLLNSVHTHTHKTSIIVYDLHETVDNSSGRRLSLIPRFHGMEAKKLLAAKLS